MSLDGAYFDRLYATSTDPWGFATRWYEQRKYALTLAALPAPHYESALEIGCSVGVLTALLAGRCSALLALDPSAGALEQARTRVPDHVTLTRASVPRDWPTGRFDLVVLSEVGYYLDPADLEELLDLVQSSLTPGGTVLACHWRHEVADYPQSGDAVHLALQRWPRLSRTLEEDFVLDVLVPGGADSVARQGGLV